MENSSKKPIMIGAVIVCLLLAVGITFLTSSKDKGLDSLESGQMIWVKCRNTDCGAEYQVDKKEYFRQIEELRRGPMEVILALCEECGQESISRAEKCENCGLLFFMGSVHNDFTDRCPECGYSKTEESRKKSRGDK